MGSQCRCCLKLNECPKSLLSHLQLAGVVHGEGSGDKCLGVILRERKHPPENAATVSAWCPFKINRAGRETLAGWGRKGFPEIRGTPYLARNTLNKYTNSDSWPILGSLSPPRPNWDCSSSGEHRKKFAQYPYSGMSSYPVWGQLLSREAGRGNRRGRQTGAIKTHQAETMAAELYHFFQLFSSLSRPNTDLVLQKKNDFHTFIRLPPALQSFLQTNLQFLARCRKKI